jgi:plasmid stabilization system protein ParE
MAQIIWTKRAGGQLESAIRFIYEEQGFHYANLVLQRIHSNVDLLTNNPEIGTVEPLLAHKKTEYRFLVVWSYKIIYRCANDKVVISRVFHTSRSPKNLKGV